ncbi:MAG: WGR domain-containing protein [Dysgonomonas sp.]
MKTFEELKTAVLQDDRQEIVRYFFDNYMEIVESLREFDQKQQIYIWDKVYYLKPVILQYADLFLAQKKLHKQPVVERIFEYYRNDTEVLNRFTDLYVYYICYWSTRCISSLRAGLKIDNLQGALLKELANAKPAEKSNVLTNLFAVCTKEEIAEIVENELKTAKGDYKNDLLFAKLKIDNAVPLDIEIPPMPAIPEQKKITPEMAQELVETAKIKVEKSHNKWIEKYPDIDLAECFLLFNNFQMTDKEREIVDKRNKYRDENHSFFTITGSGVYLLMKIVATLDPDLYLWINYCMRSCYDYDSEGVRKYELRTLEFLDRNNDFKKLPEFQDLRQIAQIVKEQAIIDFIDDHILYVGSSIRFDSKIEEPEKYWPFFAENYYVLDYAMDMFKGSMNTPMATTTVLNILDGFPSIPQRYIYPLLGLAIYENMFPAFNVLRKVPNLKEILINIKPLFNKKRQTIIDGYLDELDIEKYITPMRCFECTEAGANKFWNIRQNGTIYEVEYGTIGKDARESFKEYESMKKCKAEMEKIIAKKIKEGYVEVAPKEEPEEEKIQININQPILKADGTPYSCALPGRDEDDDYYILTDTKDIEFMKATILQLIKIVNKKSEDWFPNIGEMKNGEVTELKDNSKGYPHSFHTFVRKAYKHKELHPWLEALLEAIIEYNGKGDNFDLLQLDDEWLAGTHLAFILGQNPKNRMLFIRFMRSINKADNHTAFQEAYDEVKLPEKTDIHLHASYCATSTCCADFEPELSDFEEWPSKKQNMMLEFMREEVDYLQSELRYMNHTLERFLGTYFSFMFDGRDTKEIGRRFMAHNKFAKRITVDMLLED